MPPLPPPCSTLNSAILAAGNAGQLFSAIVPWLLLFMAVVIVGAVAIYAARRMIRGDSGSDTPEGFSLQSLRDMHAAGQLSDEEFERARGAMIGRLTQEPPPPKEPGTDDDAPDKKPQADAE